jgi:uncharacterized surface protein with fasciclin (FAS1) repeats
MARPHRLAAAAMALALALPAGAASAADIVGTAAADQRLSTFARAVQAAGMDDVLSGQGPFTVFAPTDAAFAALPAGTLDRLLQPENRIELRTLLRQHIVFDAVPPSALNVSGQVPTGNLVRVPVSGLQQPIRVGGAPVLASSRADNGFVHVIDGILVP